MMTLYFIAGLIVLTLIVAITIEVTTQYSVLSYFDRMLKDDSKEPSPKLFSGFVGLFIITGMAAAHIYGMSIDIAFVKAIIWFTLVAFGISEGGRVFMKNKAK